MTKHKIAEDNSQSKPKRQVKVHTQGEALSQDTLSAAIVEAAQKLRGESARDIEQLWMKVSDAVLDLLKLPNDQREETKEFLMVLIGTDPRLQEAIAEGIKEGE